MPVCHGGKTAVPLHSTPTTRIAAAVTVQGYSAQTMSIGRVNAHLGTPDVDLVLFCFAIFSVSLTRFHKVRLRFHTLNNL